MKISKRLDSHIFKASLLFQYRYHSSLYSGARIRSVSNHRFISIMGRKTDLIDENSATISPMRRLHDSPERPSSELTNTNDTSDDLLIQDRILPHRKRIRKDTFQSFSSLAATEAAPTVSSCLFSLISSSFSIALNRKHKLETLYDLRWIFLMVFRYQLSNNAFVVSTLNVFNIRQQYVSRIERKGETTMTRTNVELWGRQPSPVKVEKTITTTLF